MDQVASKSHARREILIFTAHMLFQPRLGPQLRPLDWQAILFTNIHRALITSHYLVFSNCVSNPPTNGKQQRHTASMWQSTTGAQATWLQSPHSWFHVTVTACLNGCPGLFELSLESSEVTTHLLSARTLQFACVRCCIILWHPYFLKE